MGLSTAIIVLSHNKKDEVLACLESVSHLNYSSYEVVVVDNGSTDGSPTAIQKKFPGYHLIQSPQNLGAIQGRNLGMHYVEENLCPEYVLFLDDDAEIGPDALSVCIDWLSQHKDTGIVCGKTYTNPHSTVIMSTGIRVHFSRASIYDIGSGEKDTGKYNESKDVDACGSFGFVIVGKLLWDLNGFHDQFNPYGWEDVDLCLRARQLGYHTTYLPDAVFCHKGTRSGRASVPRYEFYKARNFITLLKQHASWIEILSCFVWLPYRAIRLIVKFFWRGETSLILVVIRGALWGLVKGFH